MKVKTGYLYHIKDSFFNLVNDDTLMANHEKGRKRPTYFTIKNNGILWFIPLSSKVEKYQKILDKKILKYGFCDTILIENVFGNKCAILIQNAFPTLEKYISHIHTVDGKPARIPEKLEKIILEKFINLMKLKKKGRNFFFTDIDKIQKILEQDLTKNTKKLSK